jgi:aryl-alcohol dehydrogenase-like predicted oxidoreductase
VPFGPLAGGWLTGKYRRGEPFPAGSRMTQRPQSYERLVDDAVFDGLEQLDALAAARGVEMSALAFAWVLAQPGVSGAVCGPGRPDHLAPVLVARDLDLPEQEQRAIGALFG